VQHEQNWSAVDILSQCLHWLRAGHGTYSKGCDEQEPSQAGLAGRACNTRQSPLSILSQTRILGAHVRKDACSLREICRVVHIRTDRTVRGGDHAAEVSRGHSSRRKRAGPPENGRSIPGGLTPTKARTVPGRMAWVNGRGCQRACSWRHIAAVAEMPVASCLNRARQAMVLSLPVLTSRTAGYAIRMSGGVGGGSREATPYPYSKALFHSPTLTPMPLLTKRLNNGQTRKGHPELRVHPWPFLVDE
jgi:hypothetical protein